MDELVADLLSDSEEDAVGRVCLVAAQAVSYVSAQPPMSWRGRAAGSARNDNRGTCSWFEDYLSPSPTYSAARFRARFRVPMRLYGALERELPLSEPSLLQGIDFTGRCGQPLYAKLLNSLRPLGSCASFHELEDQSHISVESQRVSFLIFLRAVRARIGPRILNREPAVAELQMLSDRFAARGFPGCVGSVDCVKITWKNCPRALKGQYHNPKDGKQAVISCEAVADGDLYCWHWFAGRPGTNNDLTVASFSPLFSDILSGRRRVHLPGGYQLRGSQRFWPLYFLADSIYPRWAIIFRAIMSPATETEKHAGKQQAAVRKDVERFFGCLQGRFRILRHEREEWSDEVVLLTAEVCVIFHNLLVFMAKRGELDEEASGEDGEPPVDLVEEFSAALPHGVDEGGPHAPVRRVRLAALPDRADEVRSESGHVALRTAVIDHLWNARGEE